jgi:hypothetical protein
MVYERQQSLITSIIHKKPLIRVWKARNGGPLRPKTPDKNSRIGRENEKKKLSLIINSR